METVREDLSEQPKSFAFLNDYWTMASGWDKPIYINENNTRAGEVGLEIQDNYWQRPITNLIGGGSLTVDTWYSVQIVAVDDRFADINGSYRRSISTLGSIPVQCLTAIQGIKVTVPSFDYEDQIHLVNDTVVTQRYVYISQGATSNEALYGTFLYDRSVLGDGAKEIEITTFPSSIVTPDTDYYPPPNGSIVLSAFGRVWMTGGMNEARGQIRYVPNAFSGYVVDSIEEVDSALEIFRIELGAPLDANHHVHKGSLITLTNMDNHENLIQSQVVQRIDDTSRNWVEVQIVGGVANASVSSGIATIEANEWILNTATGTPEWSDAVIGVKLKFGDLPPLSIVHYEDDSPDYIIAERGEGDIEALGLWSVQMDGLCPNAGSDTDDHWELALSDTAIMPKNTGVGVDGFWEWDGTGLIPTMPTLTNADYEFDGNVGLYWTNINNPFAYPLENFMVFPEDCFGLAAIDRNILIFSRYRTYRVNVDALNLGYTELPGKVGTIAPFSIVNARNKVWFYDGNGFSVSDGFQTQSITTKKMEEQLDLIDRTQAKRIRGTYNAENDTIYWTYPVQGENGNNYGLAINASTMDVYPIKIQDGNIVWSAYDESDGKYYLYHATSGRFNESLKSYAFQHKESIETDNLPADSGYKAAVTSTATANALDVTVAAADTDWTLEGVAGEYNEGVPIICRALDDSNELHALAKEMETLGVRNYRIHFHTDFDLSGCSVGDHVYMACISNFWGPKWLDFGSPRYDHEVKELQLDFTPISEDALLVVDWFTELDDSTPVKIDEATLTAGDSRVTVSFKYGKCHSIGFRIRTYGPARLEINHFTVVFTTIR